MWSRTCSIKKKNIPLEKAWRIWTDVNDWKSWQDDIEYARLDGAFEKGKTIVFRPKGGPEMKLELTDVEPDVRFVDVTWFPLAKMYDSHELFMNGDELEFRSTISVGGPLAFLWRKLVAEGIAAGLEAQTAKLIARIERD